MPSSVTNRSMRITCSRRPWPIPGAAEVILHHETDWRKVIDWLTGPVPDSKAIFYQKHMAHHVLPTIGRAWLDRVTSCFLIREPKAMLASLIQVTPDPGLADTGLPQQLELFRLVRERTGRVPPVLDARDVLTDPRSALSRLCTALEVPFTERMLSWAPGLRPTDGVWARHWYGAVERSSGFRPFSPRPVELPLRCNGPSSRERSDLRAARGTPYDRTLIAMRQQFFERNRNIVVNIDGTLVHRDQAGVSPFDSTVQNGDGVWEGLRVYDGRIFRLREHLHRLRRSAHALAYEGIPDDEEIVEQIKRTLAANDMRHDVHVRLTLSRGVKFTSGLDPRLNTSGCSLFVLAEHKPPVYDKSGVRLITAGHRRPSPDVLDQKIHSCNQLTSVLAKLEANAAGADDALMLDPRRVRGGDQRDAPLPRRRRASAHAQDRRLSRGHHASRGPGAVRETRDSQWRSQT